jgi:hypothetical protein
MSELEAGKYELTQRQLEMLSIVVNYLETYSDGQTVYYDEAKCDGYCVAEDLKIAFDLD